MSSDWSLRLKERLRKVDASLFAEEEDLGDFPETLSDPPIHDLILIR